jgi:hypothetical protein
MLKTMGYLFLVILIGTFAIAWSQRSRQATITQAETLSPDTYHLNAKPLPVQDVNDMSFVFTNEK